MKKDGTVLSEIVLQMSPEMHRSIEWGGLWKQPLDNGFAFQVTTLFSIINAATEFGWSVSSPTLDLDGGDMFLLRNTVPLHHSAQAGNSATLLNKKPLDRRFQFSLVPKFTIEKGGQAYSFFIEGCPYHQIMNSMTYLDRPDIIVFEGKVIEEYPRIDTSRNEVLFGYCYEGMPITGRLRVANSPFVPCVQRNPKEGICMSAKAVIECSTNKEHYFAKNQLDKYASLFGSSTGAPNLSLVTGNYIENFEYGFCCINLNGETISTEFKRAGEQLFSSIFS